MIGRRAFLGTAALAVLATPRRGEARPIAARRIPRVGVLGEVNPIAWTVATSVAAIECRWAEDRRERLPDLASQLLAFDVDVIVALGAPAGRAASQATTRVPIVIVADGDVADIAPLARSAGNIAWLSVPSETGMAGQRLRLLARVVPRLERAAVLSNPDTVANTRVLAGLSCRALDPVRELIPFAARTLDDVERAWRTIRHEAFDGALVLADALFAMHAARLVQLATDARVPTVYGARAFVDAGGLLALYGDTGESIRRTATIVRRILAGDTPASLSLPARQRPRVTFSAAAARRLGLAFPPVLLAAGRA